jgi:hypothetical protein
MIEGGTYADQSDGDKEDEIRSSVGRLDEDVAAHPTGCHEYSESSDHGETRVRHHVVEIRDAEKRASVGEQVVAGILRDRVQRQDADEAEDEQSDQDRDALPKARIARPVRGVLPLLPASPTQHHGCVNPLAVIAPAGGVAIRSPRLLRFPGYMYLILL